MTCPPGSNEYWGLDPKFTADPYWRELEQGDIEDALLSFHAFSEPARVARLRARQDAPPPTRRQRLWSRYLRAKYETRDRLTLAWRALKGEWFDGY